MNEEQKAWNANVKAIITDAEAGIHQTPEGPTAYEHCVSQLQDAVDSAPEP